MANPRRLQRSRKKGARLPKGTVCVTRGTRWGNPYQLVRHVVGGSWGVYFEGNALSVYGDRSRAACEAVRCFRVALLAGALPVSVEDVKRELRGKDLACYCALPAEGEPDHCHAAVLLEVAAL